MVDLGDSAVLHRDDGARCLSCGASVPREHWTACEILDVDLEASISQSSRHVSPLIHQRPLAHQEHRSEVWVGLDLAELVTLHEPLLVDAEGGVAFLKEGVKPVQDRGVAEVGVLEDDPVPALYRADEDGVHPLESTLALGHAPPELADRGLPASCPFPESGQILFQESLENPDLFLWHPRPVEGVL